MKNSKIQKTVFAIALVVLPLMSFADGFPFVKLTSKENKMITLRVGSAQSEVTNIRLKNQFGQVVYSETVENVNGILKNFDLKHLESGHYKIELENALNIEVMPITITWDSVRVAHDQFTTVHKPFISLKENGTVDFNFLNLSTKSTSVMITNEKGNVIYKEDLGTSSDIEKRYDLSSLEKGTYQMIVQSGDRNFKQSIAL
ncbi:protein of unknown function [Marivirga sericea]|uniref:Por secretion system C-terminal sorting domain-containing protein n=1 Tax=Marivirga sericea TaxID=1028 RepID=A0A1X7J2P7_9BACT|nr:DUF3244 domain-containing protein [Marivirga sericea]SMG21862.1 protein of unknown function [Marivirga sericea]